MLLVVLVVLVSYLVCFYCIFALCGVSCTLFLGAVSYIAVYLPLFFARGVPGSRVGCSFLAPCLMLQASCCALFLTTLVKTLLCPVGLMSSCCVGCSPRHFWHAHTRLRQGYLHLRGAARTFLKNMVFCRKKPCCSFRAPLRFVC